MRLLFKLKVAQLNVATGCKTINLKGKHTSPNFHLIHPYNPQRAQVTVLRCSHTTTEQWRQKSSQQMQISRGRDEVWQAVLLDHGGGAALAGGRSRFNSQSLPELLTDPVLDCKISKILGFIVLSISLC